MFHPQVDNLTNEQNKYNQFVAHKFGIPKWFSYYILHLSSFVKARGTTRSRIELDSSGSKSSTLYEEEDKKGNNDLHLVKDYIRT